MRLLPLLLLLFAASASADDSDRIEKGLKENGFRCMELSRDLGAICVNQAPGIANFAEISVVIPKGVRLGRMIYSAHGDYGVCKAGVGGENFFKEHLGTLRRLGAIAVIPKRSPSRSYPSLEALAKKIDGALGGARPAWLVVGHSWAGKMLPVQLRAAPSVLARVEKVLLLDAAFDVDTLMVGPWSAVLGMKRGLRIHALSNTTWSKLESFREKINAAFPGTVTHKPPIPGDHCAAARHLEF